MVKKTSTKRGKAPKSSSGQRGNQPPRVARDPATLRPPQITQNNPNDGATIDPVVPPTLINESSPSTINNRDESIATGDELADTAIPEAPPTKSTNNLTTTPPTKFPTNPTNEPLEHRSSNGTPSVKTVDSNDNTIVKTESDMPTEARDAMDLADEMDLEMEHGNVEADEEMEHGEVEANAVEDSRNVVGDDYSDSVPLADIQWEDDYTYESAAGEHKSDSSDVLPPHFPNPASPPPQAFLAHHQTEPPHHPREMNEEEDFYFGSGHIGINQTSKDETIAYQLQREEYEGNHASTEAASDQVPLQNIAEQNVYEILKSMREDLIKKMTADDEVQKCMNGRISANQSDIAKLTTGLIDVKSLLQTLVASKKELCIFCGEDHLIAVCPDAEAFVSKIKHPVKCLYCGEKGHIMSDCVHASQFILKISQAAYSDGNSTSPEEEIDIDCDTSKDSYECLTDGQVDSLTTNPNMWKSGQTALYRHKSNIYLKVKIVEMLPFDPMSEVPPAYVVHMKAGDVQTTLGHKQLLKLQDELPSVPSKSPKPIAMTQQQIRIGNVEYVSPPNLLEVGDKVFWHHHQGLLSEVTVISVNNSLLNSNQLYQIRLKDGSSIQVSHRELFLNKTTMPREAVQYPGPVLDGIQRLSLQAHPGVTADEMVRWDMGWHEPEEIQANYVAEASYSHHLPHR
jgi:hypothetical protein